MHWTCIGVFKFCLDYFLEKPQFYYTHANKDLYVCVCVCVCGVQDAGQGGFGEVVGWNMAIRSQVSHRLGNPVSLFYKAHAKETYILGMHFFRSERRRNRERERWSLFMPSRKTDPEAPFTYFYVSENVGQRQ